MNSDAAVSALSALAQSSRLAVFRRLVELGPPGASPGELGEHLALPGATLSFHLKALQHAGLIRSAKRGRSIQYRADFAAMQSLLDYLTENCCAMQTQACPPGACAPTKAAPKTAAKAARQSTAKTTTKSTPRKR